MTENIIEAGVIETGLAPVDCRHKGCPETSTARAYVAGVGRDKPSGTPRFCEYHIGCLLAMAGVSPADE